MAMMIKKILRLIFLLAMYELGKYVTEQVYIMMTANDDVEEPSDFAKFSDQSDLMRAEVSEQMMWEIVAIGILILITLLYVIYTDKIEVREKIDELKHDIKRNEKLFENYKKENRPIEYIVELYDGVYLQEEYTGAFSKMITLTTTSNVFEAKSYDNLFLAKIDAEFLSGRVLKYKPNLEVIEQMMWFIIAIILLVILLFGVMLQAEQLKGDVKVKEREIEILRSRLRHFED